MCRYRWWYKMAHRDHFRQWYAFIWSCWSDYLRHTTFGQHSICNSQRTRLAAAEDIIKHEEYSSHRHVALGVKQAISSAKNEFLFPCYCNKHKYKADYASSTLNKWLMGMYLTVALFIPSAIRCVTGSVKLLNDRAPKNSAPHIKKFRETLIKRRMSHHKNLKKRQ